MDTLNKILYLLKKNGMSEIELAKQLNVSRSTITDWKRGKTKSYNRRLPQIAKILEVSTEYLMTDSNDILSLHSEIGKKDDLYVQQSEKLIDIKEEENLTQYLTKEEKILLDNYRKLDHRGKIRTNNLIYDELERIEQSGDIPKTQNFTENY